MLTFTINQTLDHRATFQRDEQQRDRWGGDIGADEWTDITIVPCAWWWEKQGGRGPAKEEATPSETVLNSEGGMLIPGGTDVQPGDRIRQITSRDGTVVLPGPLRITAILPHASQPPLIELAWKQPA